MLITFSMKQRKCIDLDTFFFYISCFFHQKVAKFAALRIFHWDFSTFSLTYLYCLHAYVFGSACLLGSALLIGSAFLIVSARLPDLKKSYPSRLLGSARFRNVLKIPPCPLIKQVRLGDTNSHGFLLTSFLYSFAWFN